MDKVYGYGQQQHRRNKKAECRENDESYNDRLADGFDLLAEDDLEDPLSNQVSGREEDYNANRRSYDRK